MLIGAIPLPNQVVCQIAIGMVMGSLAVSCIVVARQNRRLNKAIKRRRQVEAALGTSEAHYYALIHALPDLIMRINRAGIYLEFLASPDFAILPQDTSTWIGTHVTDRMPTDLATKRLDAIKQALATQSIQVYEQDLVIDGTRQVEQVRVVPYSHDEVLILVQDISDRSKAEEQLKYDAFHDQLTGLPNRSLLMERLELALKRTKRHPETQLAVLFLDLDNFKIINDSLGHHIGDELLLAISNRLKLAIRETDLAVRLGGDEFVVLLEEVSGLTEVVMVVERILEILKLPITLANRELFPSASIGIVMYMQKYHHGATDLLRDADVAMYWAKHNGRGQYKVFDPNMHHQATQRLNMEINLRQALKNKEFVIYYQPIINLKTQEVEAFEALIRWQHPEQGLLGPERFIGIAEEIGLISPMGEWVLRTACQQLSRWQAQCPEKSLQVSINLSAQQLDNSLLLSLEDLLTHHSLRENTLMLEIPESTLVQNVDVARDLLDQLQHKGVGIVIDDFGAGDSCLRYLHQLPINGLKLEREFIRSNGADSRHRMIVESIISLCKSLDLQTIAEGIEASEQVDWLQEMGCDLGQGFYFAKPMTAAEVTDLLASRSGAG